MPKKIVVIGGTGLVGSQVIRQLKDHGHEAVSATPGSGADAVTGEGLTDVFAGADVVVDLSNSPSFADDDVLAFFTASTTNLTAAARAEGVGHYVALSVVGSRGLPDSGYLRAKVAQEDLILASGLPYSLVHATQFFEFAGSMAAAGTVDGEVRLPDALVQPIASADVATVVARTAAGDPRNGGFDIAGPEALRFGDFIKVALESVGDDRAIVVDPAAEYFGTRLQERSLVPAENGDAELTPTRFAAWLDANTLRV
ncbi:MAG: SDR family oxidoreductase [Solirubrobacteraceae bacterium]|nr:SDR family oxidoreductase [Solirubrobacteraceae bacterium]